MEFLFSVYTWTLCYGGQGNLYVSSLSADGGWVNASICMSLDSLLMEDMEMVLFVRTGTLCWRRARNCFSLYVPGLSAGGGHEIASLYVPGLIAGGGQGIASLCTPWTLCWWRTRKCFSQYVTGLSASGEQENASFSTYMGSLLWRTWRCFLSLHRWTLCCWRARKCFSLYMPGLTTGGGHGIASICTYLESFEFSLYKPGLCW